MTTSNDTTAVVSAEDRKVTKQDLRKVFWRSCSMNFSWNFERQCSMGFAYAMAPIIKKLYVKKEDRAEALKRHLEFYNVAQWTSTLQLGITTAMEEEKAANPDSFDTNSINSVKTALMGPLAALGDSFFWGTMRLLATAIGTSFALQGNIIGPILFLIVFNIPAFAVRFGLMGMGYNAGTGFLSKLEKGGALADLTYGAAILGLIVIGAMVASMVRVTTPIMIGDGDTAHSVQAMFDSIMPRLLPLLAFGCVYKLLGKKVNPLVILLGTFVIAILAALFGILG